MARLSRLEVFCPEEVAVEQMMNRVVRRCFLFGTDPVSGKNFDHRKVWIEEQLRLQAACFGIDVLGFAILSNHFHLICGLDLTASRHGMTPKLTPGERGMSVP